MLAKRLLHKALHHSKHNLEQYSSLTSEDLDLQIAVHYGIPATASILAFDHIQRLLAIGTLDGRIKVIGGDGIEGLLISPKQLPYKFLEFIQNQGLLVSITNDNEIQVWNLESRSLACCLQWESNITAFSVVGGSCFMYVGDEYGLMSVIKCDSEKWKLLLLSYNIYAKAFSEVAGLPVPDHLPVVGVLPQPCSSGDRVLIAYENGLLILWDVFEAQILFVGGGRDLHLMDKALHCPDEADSSLPDDTTEHHLSGKEISALCWASLRGSVLAVGYIDGDILFWNTLKSQQRGSSNNVVKLRLSSAGRRLPVIILHWSSNNETRTGSLGRLFIYGGDEIGSEEVITVLNLEWSSGMQTLRCVGRVDLSLNGAFADMILSPGAGSSRGHHKADFIVLTSPGNLHLYDDASLSALLSQKERKPSAGAVDFPSVIPTANPSMTVAKFSILPSGEPRQKIASVMKLRSSSSLAGGVKWPLTGGVPYQLSAARSNDVEKVYIAGYQDGSVCVWDATYSVLKLLCVFEGKVPGTEVANASTPVSNLTFCSLTSSLAVGNESGLVRIYNLDGNSDASNFFSVTETKREVHKLTEGKGSLCRAAFSLLNSPVQALEFSNCGAKLAVGFECGRVAVLDMSTMAVSFNTYGLSSNNSPLISMSWIRNVSESEIPDKHVEEVIFILFKDTKLGIIDGGTGKMINSSTWHIKKKSTAISMYVIGQSTLCGFATGKHLDQSGWDNADENKPVLDSISSGIDSNETEHPSSSETSGKLLAETLFLLCCEDSLRLYSKDSVIQRKKKTLHKVKHAKPCCWTSTLKKDGKVCGLFLLFKTGVFEIRSLPDLELVKESSLMSILRWNFKPNMDKLMGSDDGQITMTNGSEVSFLGVLGAENGFRIQESMPCLHDKVLAAAADAAFNISSNQKKKQDTKPGFLDGIVNGLKGGIVLHKSDINTTPKSSLTRLEEKFLKPPFPDTYPPVPKNEEDAELDIDDIEIDDVQPMATSSSPGVTYTKRDKGSERERLLGEPDDKKPGRKTYEEVVAKYRKAEDASSAATHARNKLIERQEKLERISRRTEELESGAQDFANLANELVKTMENRKWYHI